jgi:hypothetical protein
VAPFIAEGKLVSVLADWSPQGPDFVLFYSSRRHVPLKLRALVDFLRGEARHARTRKEDTVRRTTPARVLNSYPAARMVHCPVQYAAG